MLRSRIIPCLLLQNGGLVKTRRFAEPKYLGDPVNTVRILNEKHVDELVLFDIDATMRRSEPDYNLIRALAAECRMPLCYGGGVTRVDQIEKIIMLGVEKVCLGSAASTPDLLDQAVQRVGSQSIVAVIDIKKSGLLGGYHVFTHNGTRKLSRSPIDLAKDYESAGVGEIIINSIDRDGTMKGYDYDLIDSIRARINLPMTVLGGAGSLDDVSSLIQRYGLIGAGAGSIFVFKGKYRAVLIQYPQRAQKDLIVQLGCRD